MRIISSKIIIKSLINEEIEFVFGYPGGSVLHIYDEIYKLKVKHILVRHEQAAVHAADAYSRSSFKIGVVIVTSGPGYTNCITGIATASFDQSSIFIICGQVNKGLISQNAFQETNHLCISLPIVKQFYSINCFYNISYIIHNSFKNLKKSKKGPIILEIPKDLTSPYKSTRFKYPIKKIKNKKKISLLNFEIENYKRPIFIIGGGCCDKTAYKNIYNIINNYKIPFVTTLMGVGKISYKSVYYLGILGMHGDSISNIIINYSDLIICLGTRLDDRITNNNKLFAPYAKIIQLDINENSINKNTITKQYYIFNINFFSNFNFYKLKKQYWKLIIFYFKFFKIKYKNNFNYCNPQQIIELLYYLSRGKLLITTDVGQHQMFVMKFYKFNYNKLITSGGLGTMGFGFPAAIGCKFANKNKKICLITGEGSFLMMMQELSTCKQYNVYIIIINLNNQSLGMVKQWQEINYLSRYSNSYVYSLPNFKKFINSYNLLSYNFIRLKNVYNFSLKIFNTNKFIFINIYINVKENVYPIQLPNKSMNEFSTFFCKKKYDKKFNFYI